MDSSNWRQQEAVTMETYWEKDLYGFLIWSIRTPVSRLWFMRNFQQELHHVRIRGLGREDVRLTHCASLLKALDFCSNKKTYILDTDRLGALVRRRGHSFSKLLSHPHRQQSWKSGRWEGESWVRAGELECAWVGPSVQAPIRPRGASGIYREDKHPSVVTKVITESKTFVYNFTIKETYYLLISHAWQWSLSQVPDSSLALSKLWPIPTR